MALFFVGNKNPRLVAENSSESTYNRARVVHFCTTARRKVENEQNASTPTAQDFFGLPQGSQVVLRRTMADHIFSMVASKDPVMARALEAIHQQAATVTVANDDLVELSLNGPISAGPGYENVTMKLARANGLFGMSISGAGTAPLQYEAKDLAASRDGEKYILASGEPQVRFTPSAGTVEVEAYTAPFLKEASAMVKAFAPKLVGLFSATVSAT